MSNVSEVEVSGNNLQTLISLGNFLLITFCLVLLHIYLGKVNHWVRLVNKYINGVILMRFLILSQLLKVELKIIFCLVYFRLYMHISFKFLSSQILIFFFGLLHFDPLSFTENTRKPSKYKNISPSQWSMVFVHPDTFFVQQ